ncbi:MAG: right-handed parallel beta-helix repeat-containing protein [Thermoleophilia bacterium]|nr:right-handed parallel beta-helix repeat-containing protein [Thermoleophilia bacterium]
MRRSVRFAVAMMGLGISATLNARASDPPGPGPDERQLPDAMHSAMDDRPTVTVGRADADIVGADNRALQAAVDYVAGLGGGTVEIREGTYLMRDSLHLRSNVTVRGEPGKVVLRKADGPTTTLTLDGDFGEQQITVADPAGFVVGGGVAVWDDNAGGFHTTVARITGRRGNTFAIDQPLMSDCMVAAHAKAAAVFPVVSGRDVRNARVEGLVVDGNKARNSALNGCRGAGIYLYRGFGTTIKNCVVRDYHGDGISFQQSNDVTVVGCTVEGNTDLGLHPGSGSQRPTVKGNVARNNGTDGLFLCWRVRHGVFEGNTLEGNGRFGISIGHKDSDNLLQKNVVRRNASNGVFFRNEETPMSPHRNRLVENRIEDNGREPGTAGIRVRGAPSGLVFEKNVVRDTRSDSPTQTVGILIEDRVGPVEVGANEIEAPRPLEDRRPSAPAGR